MGEDKHQHICRFCDKSFSSGRSLGGHMRSHLSSSEPLLEEDNPPRKPCSCKLCGQVFRSLKALYGHMRWHSDDKPPLLGFIIGGRGEGAPPQPRKRKRGSRKPRRDFLASPSSVSEEEEEAAECLLMLSGGGHWVEVHHPSRADSEETPVSADSEAEEKDRPMEEPNPSMVMPSKDHRCIVCEKVFPSGQALGGHMRSHYNAQPKKKEKEPCRAVRITGLFDLNLPAMPEY